jgi:hypothetical protein
MRMWAPDLLTWRKCVALYSPSVRMGSVCLAGCLKCAAKRSVSVLQLCAGYDTVRGKSNAMSVDATSCWRDSGQREGYRSDTPPVR